ncbi:MAG: hypothetical protein OXN25_16190 [Candidatus Poribacteria bacterium]|nr:hypothetical protein [Candidatus Poribacteria bacterium]MYK20517.1 hypothetical protein [Candidatus Poribacteria bacterium]
MKKESGLWKSVRDFWKTGKTGFALFLISLFGIIYSYMALNYEILRGWNGHVSVQNVVKDISASIPVAGLLVGIIVGGIDAIMLLSDWYLARQEKRIQAAEEAAKAEGLEQGIEQGKAEVYQQIAEWNERRKAAEARGESFAEPPPGITQNGSER